MKLNQPREQDLAFYPNISDFYQHSLSKFKVNFYLFIPPNHFPNSLRDTKMCNDFFHELHNGILICIFSYSHFSLSSKIMSSN